MAQRWAGIAYCMMPKPATHRRFTRAILTAITVNKATGTVYLDRSTVNESAKTPMIDAWDSWSFKQPILEKYNTVEWNPLVTAENPDVAAGTSGKALPAKTSGIYGIVSFKWPLRTSEI